MALKTSSLFSLKQPKVAFSSLWVPLSIKVREYPVKRKIPKLKEILAYEISFTPPAWVRLLSSMQAISFNGIICSLWNCKCIITGRS